MKYGLLFTALFILSIFTASYGQNMVINGDFENNTAPHDTINCTAPAFNSLMSNVHSFGTWPNPDIIKSNNFCNYAEHGTWFIALTGGGTDDIAMQLSQPIVAGNKYALSFWTESCKNYGGVFAFEIGISANDSTLGTVVFKAPTPTNGTWTNVIDTFTAPVSGSYITFQGQTGYINTWSQLDNVSLKTVTPVTTISLNAPPQVCANQPTTIALNGNSDSTYIYKWNFGSGNVLSGSGAGPYQVAWATPGTYSVSLSVVYSIGDTTTTTDSIVVNAIPTSSFVTLDTTIAAGQTDLVNYSGTGSIAASYNWGFNNAFIENNNGITSYNFTWAVPGTYNVTLSVSENGCSSPMTQQSITVTNPIAVATPVCTDSISMVTYSGFVGNTGMYNWNFSGANIIAGSGAGPYTLQYAAPGSYPVSLSVTFDSVNYFYTDTIVVTSGGTCFKGVKDSTTKTLKSGGDSTTINTGIVPSTNQLAITTIYPNPTLDNLNINVKNISGSVHVDVYDVLGRTIISDIKTISAAENTIVLNTDQLPAGSYFIRLSDDANYSDTEKFIKLL